MLVTVALSVSRVIQVLSNAYALMPFAAPCVAVPTPLALACPMQGVATVQVFILQVRPRPASWAAYSCGDSAAHSNRWFSWCVVMCLAWLGPKAIGFGLALAWLVQALA